MNTIGFKNKTSLKHLAILLFFASLFFNSCKTTQKTVQTPVNKPVVSQPVAKPVADEKPKEIIKETKEFKIALLLPLYLETNLEIDTSDTEVDIEPRSLNALSFYEGALLAVDSLTRAGLKVKLSVFDIAADSSAKHVVLFNYPALKNFDLVVANFPSSQAKAAADIAKQYRIKMVLTQFGNTSLLQGNPDFVLASPSSATQCKLMARHILNEYHYSDFLILTRNNKRENELADIFKKETDSLLTNEYKSTSQTVVFNYADSGKKTFTNYFSPAKRTIVYFPSSDESYVSSVLARLDTMDRKITVVGLPTWENFETIPFSKLSNIEVYIFSNAYVDPEEEHTAYVRKKFIDHYKGDPLFSGYQGFYLTCFFTKLFGEFEKKMMDNIDKETYSPPFKFKREAKDDGCENTAVSVLKFRDYRLLKVNK